MTAYRASAPLCPTCHQPLEAHSIREPVAVVDLCGKCGGVWIDWEDGDFTELSRAVPPAPVREMPRGGPGQCPRCNRPLVVEVFQETAEVLRCTDCAGAFLPYASIGKIAATTPAEARASQKDAPESREEAESASGPEESTWARIVKTVRDWLGSPRST